MTSPDPLFAVDREVVVITGVSGQLGGTYARGFLERGAHVIGVDLRHGGAIESLGDEFPGRFMFHPGDVTSAADLRGVLEATERRCGPPTVLINNAAIDSPPNASHEETGPFEQYPDSSWDRVMDVNVKGVYLACKVFGGEMARRRRGSIVNISSIYGVVSPDQSIYDYRRERGEVFFKPVAYAASKSALLNLTRYLAVYWAKAGVRVNTLVIAGVRNDQEEAFLKAYCQRIPVGRMAASHEYVGAVVFLSSHASKYMTGAQVIVDGGWTAI